MRNGLGLVKAPDTDHLDKHPARAALLAQGDVTLDYDTPLTSDWRLFYNQGSTPQCVGFSVSEATSLRHRVSLDAPWLYAECKARDGYNGPGTYLRVAFDVLKEIGHKRYRSLGGPDPSYGVERFEWVTTVEGIRRALAAGNVVVVGTNWYEFMFEPSRKDGRFRLQDYLPPGSLSVGGHAYLLTGGSDSRDAFRMPNSWGRPDRSWHPGEAGWPVTELPYPLMERLLSENGEAAIPIWRR